MYFLKQTIFVMSLWGFGWANAKTINYQPVTFPAGDFKKIVVEGFAGDIKIVGKDKTSTLNMTVVQRTDEKAPDDLKRLFDQWVFSYKIEDSTLYIYIRSPQSTKEEWGQIINHKTKSFPSYDMVLVGPPRSMQIYWLRGNISAQNWSAGLQVTNQHGSVVSSSGRGDFKAFLMTGKIQVNQHQGQLDLESYEAEIKIDGHKGDIRLENFAGPTSVENFDGGLNLVSFKGTSRVSRSKGQIDFANGRSLLKIDQFSGDLRGKSDQGAVVAHLLGSVNVRIKSEDGPISLRVPQSGASVNIGSVKGALLAPHFLHLNRFPNIKTMTGRLRGGAGGSIFVRTQTGQIRIQ